MTCISLEMFAGSVANGGYGMENTIYDIYGVGHKQFYYSGYIGKFDIDTAVSGGGQYSIMVVPHTSDIKKLVVHGNNITALGPAQVYKDNIYQIVPCVIELNYNISTDNYTYKHEYTSWGEEELLDLVNANGKIVVLSRNTNPAHFMYYRFCFGLRYGTPGDFINTNSVVYNYNTDNILPNANLTKFQGDETLRLCTSNNANGVSVNYVINFEADQDSWKGRFLSFLIPSQASSTVRVAIGKHPSYFSEVKDVMFNQPLNRSTYPSLLLIDTNGNSVIRNPLYYNTITTYDDPSLKLADPIVESLQPFQSTSNEIELAMGGYYANNANKISSIREYGIHQHLSYWNTMNCFDVQEGTNDSYTTSTATMYTDSHPLVIGRSGICNFRTANFQTKINLPISQCTDGFTY